MAADTVRGRQGESEAEEAGFQDRLNRQVEQARQRFNEGMLTARDRLGDARLRAGDAWDDAVDFVRENPGKIIVASLGLGVAVGLTVRFLRMRSGEDIE